MKQSQIIQAQPSLKKIVNMHFTAKKAYQIYLLSKKVNSIIDFFIEEERKLISKFNAEIKENGEVIFKNAGDAQNFREAYAALQNFEVDLELPPVILTEADVQDKELSPADIFNLEGLITFE